MPEPLPFGLVRHRQYPGRKRRNFFAQELCTKKALQYQWPNSGAEFLNFCTISSPIVDHSTPRTRNPMRYLIPILLNGLFTLGFAQMAVADCTATNTNTHALSCSCASSNCSQGQQCYCENSSGGGSPVCECRSGRGSLQSRVVVTQATQWKICSRFGLVNRTCVIRQVDQTCPSGHASVGKMWYSSPAEACADAHGRDDCADGVTC